MSVYNPPNFEEYLSVFNPANWIEPSAGEIDTAYLDANYLRFPSAQGSENLLNTTIKNTSINGDLTINNTSNLISFTDTPALTNLLLHGNNPPIPTSATLSNCQVAGYGVFQNHTNKIINSCIAIGSLVLRNATNVVSTDPVINNIGIGTNSLATLVNSPNAFGYNTGSNIGIGLDSLDELLNGENNTYIGHQQIGPGEKLLQGNRNTFLGSDTSISSAFFGNCNNSTAVGYGAQITANNQVVLGRNTEEVYIPNLIRFPDGSSINSNTLNYTFSGLVPPYSFSTSYEVLNKIAYLSTTAVGNITWINPNNSNASNKLCTIFNTGQFQINLIITSGVFSGKYGSGGTQLIVPANTFVQIHSNGTNWRVDDRSAENQFYYPTAFTSASETIATNFQYINAELHLTSTFAGSVSLTLPAVSVAQTKNQKYKIYNDNSLLATPNSHPIVLTSTGTSYFRGIYQNNATGATQLTYTLAPNSNVEFYNNGTNWVITSIGEVGNQLTPIQTSAPNNPTVITRPFRKNYIISNAVGGINQGFRLPVPLASDLGTEIFIRKGWNYPGTSSSFYLDNAGSTTPPSTTNPVYTLLSTIAQPVVTSGNHLGNVLGGRFTVLQYGYAGTGSIAFVNGLTTCTVSLISTGAVITHYQPIVLTGAPVASVQVNERATSGGIGGNGTYILTTAWTNPDATYSFTISDFYAWTQIQ
jgi:hypothetical protein